MVGVAGNKEGFPEEEPRKVQEDGEEVSAGETWSGWRVRTGGMKQNGMFGCSVIIRTFPGCQGCMNWAGGVAFGNPPSMDRSLNSPGSYFFTESGSHSVV